MYYIKKIRIRKMDDIEKRKPVWLTLSEFYLDTELNDVDYNQLTQALRLSGYSLKQLKQIDTYEVFPVLQSNLLSVAGVWDSFDNEWLIDRCTKMYLRDGNLMHEGIMHLLNLIFYPMRKDHWEQLEKRFNLLA
jgi:hypothetical protein